MNIQERKDLLVQLGVIMTSEDSDWQQAKQKAYTENQWFTPEFIDLAIKNISENYLQPEQLQQLIDRYHIPATNGSPKKVGIVMAGNIPLVGFHDLLCVFISGHEAHIKPSSKDQQLIQAIVKKLSEWNAEAGQALFIREMLKGCDAYIATGSNNSSRYFEYYFRNLPHIIRKNRTSVAVLDGTETGAELEKLADDVYSYFGLGCRNVTKIFVPEEYDFVPLLQAFKKYNQLADHNKYKNNYDYNLALHMLNRRPYMTNESIILVEDASEFSPISQLHYETYKDIEAVKKKLEDNNQIQCVVGKHQVGFGQAQVPGICTFADGVDTMDFLMELR
jgi:hypothetical protein